MQRPQQFPRDPFTTSQALALGFRKVDLAAAVRERRLIRVLRGVYLRSDVPLSTLTRAQAAALVTSPHAVLCDRTAAWVHGVDALRYAELDLEPPLEVFVLRGHRRIDRPQCSGGERDLSPRDWVLVGGVRVTTPVRTALDLGCKLPRREALAAMDALMRECGFTPADLQRELPRYARRRGVIQLRELAALVDPQAESSGESWTRLAILEHGLPAPRLQHWVCVDGVPAYRLDLAYPHARVAVEYDGEDWHSDPAARERDRQRRTWLREHGWIVIVVDKSSFTSEGLDTWISELAASLRSRAASARFGIAGRAARP